MFSLLLYIYITNILLDYNKVNEGPGHNERRMCKGGSGEANEPKRVETTRLGYRCAFLFFLCIFSLLIINLHLR